MTVDTRTGTIKAGGVTIKGLDVTTAPRKINAKQPLLEKYVFIPEKQEQELNMTGDQDDIYEEFLLESIKPCIDITLENVSASKPKVVEYGSNMGCMYEHIYPILKHEPGVDFEYLLADISFENLEDDDVGIFKMVQLHLDDCRLPDTLNKADLAAVNLASGQNQYFRKILQLLPTSLKDGGFLLLVGSAGIDWPPEDEGLNLVFKKIENGTLSISLWRKVDTSSKKNHIFISVDSMNYEWVSELKQALIDPQVDRVWLTSGEVSRSGLLGLTKCVRKEPDGHKVRYILKIVGSDISLFK